MHRRGRRFACDRPRKVFGDFSLDGSNHRRAHFDARGSMQQRNRAEAGGDGLGEVGRSRVSHTDAQSGAGAGSIYLSFHHPCALKRHQSKAEGFGRGRLGACKRRERTTVLFDERECFG